MLFSDIRPYVRYARKMTVTADMRYPVFYPYDARLFFVKSGEGEIAADGVTLSMTKGAAVVINAGVKYHLKTPRQSVTFTAVNFDYTRSHSHLTVPIPPAAKNGFHPELITEQVTFEDQPAFDRFVYIPEAGSIEKIGEILIGEYNQKLIGCDMTCGALLTEMLVEILRKSSAVQSQDKDIVKKILDYIHENYAKPITNKSIAGHFGFHPNYLSSLVKAGTGLPMHKYILQVRLLHAAKLIETGLYGINEVAERSGFCDVFYFSKYFKAAMGVTPTEFAKGTRR